MPLTPPVVRRPRHWLLGSAYYAQRRPLIYLPRWIEEHGDIFTIVSPLGKATVLARPEWARRVLVEGYRRYQAKSRAYGVLRILFGDGLVTSEGELWRSQRKLIQPAFHRSRLEGWFPMMAERAMDCARRLAEAGRAGAAVDVGPVFSRLALDIIARAMFSTDVEGAAAGVSGHIATLNEYAIRMIRRPWLFLLPRRFPTPFNHRQYRALRSLNEIVFGIIRERRRRGEKRDDLLGLLLSACDEESGRRMTDQQLRDEVMTIFVAGHETTANAMSWLTHLVARHPEVEERLVAEIDARWPEGGLTPSSAAGFDYARAVIDESLRVHPTIWSVGRKAGEADEIGGFEIPEGRNILVPIFHFHWSERYWTEPARFDPDRFNPGRFAPEKRGAIDPSVYLPFGAGPRGCIGNHFALQELLILTATFYRYLRLRLEPGASVERDPLITLRPKEPIRLRIEPRRSLEAAPAARAIAAR